MSEDEELQSQRQHAEDAQATRELLNMVDFGLEVQQFLKGKIGRHVASRAQEQMWEAATALTTAPANKPLKIIELQQRYAVASAALSWLAQAVEEGHQAEQTYLAQQQGG